MFTPTKNPNRVLAESFDPHKLVLICHEHMYAGKGLPTERCAKCQQVWWMNWAAKLPPEKRTEIIEHMHELVSKVIELEEKKQFDVELYRHPEISIEKGND